MRSVRQGVIRSDLSCIKFLVQQEAVRFTPILWMAVFCHAMQTTPSTEGGGVMGGMSGGW